MPHRRTHRLPSVARHGKMPGERAVYIDYRKAVAELIDSFGPGPWDRKKRAKFRREKKALAREFFRGERRRRRKAS